MAGRKSKRAQAQKADPQPAAQPKKPLAPRPQAQDQNQERAKKQQANSQPKPAVENTNPAGAKAELGDKTGDNTGDKTNNKTRRPQKKRQENKTTISPAAQAEAELPLPDGCRFKKQRPNKSLKGNNKATHPTATRAVAKLPFPESYTPPKHQPPSKRSPNRSQRPSKMAPSSSAPRVVHLKPAEFDAAYVSPKATLLFHHPPQVSNVLTCPASNTARGVGELLRLQSQPCLALVGRKR